MDKKPRVLQINKLYYPHIGGVEKVVQDIAEGLSDKAHMDVLACQDKGSFCQEIINGINVTKASSLGIHFSMPISFQFPFLLKKMCHQYDVLHFHMPFPLGDIACLLSGYKGKVIAWWHSDIVRQKKLLKLYEPFLYQFLDRVDKIIVATPNHIESSAFLKSYRDKCVVIPFGIDLDTFGTNEKILHKISSIKEQHQRPIVLFVGRLIYYKGVEYLIEAMRKIDADLVLIGKGILEDKLKDMVNEFGMQERVCFKGEISYEEIIAYYHACDLFVLPSIANSEAFGLVQLEVMACSKPVINTALQTGVPYVSIHNETGLTVPPSDPQALRKAISELIDNKTMRIEMGNKARERVEKYFTKDKMLEAVLRLYNE